MLKNYKMVCREICIVICPVVRSKENPCLWCKPHLKRFSPKLLIRNHSYWTLSGHTFIDDTFMTFSLIGSADPSNKWINLYLRSKVIASLNFNTLVLRSSNEGIEIRYEISIFGVWRWRNEEPSMHHAHFPKSDQNVKNRKPAKKKRVAQKTSEKSQITRSLLVLLDSISV